jgi:hypothetical protein
LRALKTSVQIALAVLNEEESPTLSILKARTVLQSALSQLGVQSEAELLSKQS